MLSPKKVKVAVESTVVLPLRVKVDGVDQGVEKSLTLLQQLGLSMLTSDAGVTEEGFATFLLPARWTAEPWKKTLWTIISDGDNHVLRVFTGKASVRKPPYISIVS